MSINKILPALAALLILTSCKAAPSNDSTLIDTQLIQLVKQTDRKPVEGQPNLAIGVYNGTKVIEAFHCSDLCPENTLRIIHYDVPDVESCARIGGVIKQILVPIAITVAPRQFCFPEVIADNWESYLP